MCAKIRLPVGNGLTAVPTSHTINRLLKTKRYDELSALLSQAELNLQPTPDHHLLKDILCAARQISMACSMCHTGSKWHRWAADEAEHQEHEFEQLLLSLTEIMDGNTLEQVVRNPNGNLTFWQRIQKLLNHEIQPSADEVAHAVFEMPAQIQPSDNARISETTSNETAPPSHYSFVVHTLGAFRVFQNDLPVENWPNRKSKLIFKYLLLNRKQPVFKEVLMNCFWPDANFEAARNNLNVTIYNLRQSLRENNETFSHILFQDDCYLLNPDLNIWVDFETFLAYVENARQLERAGDTAQAVREYSSAELLYQGALFDEDRYEDWMMPLRRQLQDAYVNILEWLSCYHSDQQNYAACVTVCHKILSVDPCQEAAHRQLMCCYSRQGQHYLALRQYHLCVEAHEKELNTRPSPETTALYERIRTHHHTS